jgi:cyclic nucleotide gated channel
LQFRLAYVSPESRVVGAGDLVDVLKKIGVYYLKSYFLIDLFVVILPLPQVKIFSSSSFPYGFFFSFSRPN